ncbi:MAG: hypothetical protein QNK85_02750 [Crocinitomicaceae bacterium]
MSSCTALTLLDCSNNQLECLNVKNGNNTSFTLFFYAEGNPSLTCIEVDDVNYSTTNWTNIDSQTSFSTSCSNGGCSLDITELNNTPKKLINSGHTRHRDTL